MKTNIESKKCWYGRWSSLWVCFQLFATRQAARVAIRHRSILAPLWQWCHILGPDSKLPAAKVSGCGCDTIRRCSLFGRNNILQYKEHLTCSMLMSSTQLPGCGVIWCKVQAKLGIPKTAVRFFKGKSNKAKSGVRNLQKIDFLDSNFSKIGAGIIYYHLQNNIRKKEKKTHQNPCRTLVSKWDWKHTFLTFVASGPFVRWILHGIPDNKLLLSINFEFPSTLH